MLRHETIIKWCKFGNVIFIDWFNQNKVNWQYESRLDPHFLKYLLEIGNGATTTTTMGDKMSIPNEMLLHTKIMLIT